MKTFSEYLQFKRLNEEGPGHGPRGHDPMGGHHGPAPIGHGGPATGLGMGFGPAMPMARPAMTLRRVPASTFGLSFLTPLNTTWWTMPVWSLYSDRWPGDSYGRLINRSLTFADLAKALDLAISPFDVIGTDNPKVVKKVLKLLAKILGRSYADICGYQPQSGLFTDYDVQLDELSQRLGVLLAPKS